LERTIQNMLDVGKSASVDRAVMETLLHSSAKIAGV